ncbi:helix-turn-helix domain-containing protein [Paracoccus sp. 11-3]|uniref:Helix-turn-helix domain-containing protein n=1 Tax=Paracoccus amoyensis TaxID=2760093 RepID=A0A926J6A5_9RHOB|nr:helix-turn-helix domain-containing protein [Paracoccus amoyensis]MBC9247072.1 helix-turn-helix domain-containing protein [Paracoccus amoyensis]
MSRLRADYPAEGIMQVEEVEHFLDDDTRLGDIMRGERATMGKSLLDVQRELRIRASYVAAIENCDITAFDTPSFIAGYVRSYARYLGMDSDWVFRRFCAESGFQPTHGMAPTASGPKPARRPSDPAEALANPRALFLPQQESFWSGIEPRAIGAVLVLILLVGGLGYGGWTVLQEVQRVTLSPGEDSPDIVTALDPTENAGMTGPALDMSDTTELAQNLPQPESLDRLYRPQILEAPVLTSRDGPIAAIDPGLTAATSSSQDTAVAENLGLPDAVQAAIQTALSNVNGSGPMDYGPQMPLQSTQMAMTVAADAPPLELLAARPAWVRVTSSDGTVLLEKIMDAGERFTLPSLEQAPLLRTGNSGAVYFAVNGRTYGPAAPGPQVIKNVELSQENLTSTYTLADLNADPELAQMVAMAQAPMSGSSVTE